MFLIQCDKCKQQAGFNGIGLGIGQLIPVGWVAHCEVLVHGDPQPKGPGKLAVWRHYCASCAIDALTESAKAGH